MFFDFLLQRKDRTWADVTPDRLEQLSAALQCPPPLAGLLVKLTQEPGWLTLATLWVLWPTLPLWPSAGVAIWSTAARLFLFLFHTPALG